MLKPEKITWIETVKVNHNGVTKRAAEGVLQMTKKAEILISRSSWIEFGYETKSCRIGSFIIRIQCFKQVSMYSLVLN